MYGPLNNHSWEKLALPGLNKPYYFKAALHDNMFLSDRRKASKELRWNS